MAAEVTQTQPRGTPSQRVKLMDRVMQWLAVLGLLYLFICFVSAVSEGFSLFSEQEIRGLMELATNPLTGLIVGVLGTALTQSSSTITTIIVGMVAAGLPVTVAVPMVLGANIGTTITNTIVSLGHIREREEFRRAFAAGTIHDFYNMLAVAIFLPIELLFKPLERTADYLAHVFDVDMAVSIAEFNFAQAAVNPIVHVVRDLCVFFVGLVGVNPETVHPSHLIGGLMILISIAGIFTCIVLISRLVMAIIIGRTKSILHVIIGRGPFAGIASGTIITMLVQSSSTTTSLMMPLAGTGIVTLNTVYAFTVGANVGTTVTALLAAMTLSGPNADLALQIAIVHVLFNVAALLTVFSIPFLRAVPPYLAAKLADLATLRKIYALLYVILLYFALPAAVLVTSNLISQ